MPDTACPKCKRTGFVRKERVIKGDTSKHAFYCGACDYAWAISDVENGAARANLTAAPGDKPKRSS